MSARTQTYPNAQTKTAPNDAASGSLRSGEAQAAWRLIPGKFHSIILSHLSVVASMQLTISAEGDNVRINLVINRNCRSLTVFLISSCS